ncbi:uracil-DNA glycosylase family protein [Granulosicoccaceae sp. 1_MG-2023]|nr:uracil-DNA glycosylase family protein [Granulosicoccaceae sp. 1_MG-2023]
MTDFDSLLAGVRACRLCEATLPQPPRPVLQASATARILIVGQAPGRLAHEAGRPFSDPSGERLRRWLGVDETVFYDASRIALLPMGFCFPGSGKGGDLPPPPACAQAWRADLLAAMPEVALTVILGRYAIDWHLPQARRQSLSAVTAAWRDYWPQLLPMPHPSPRNHRWLKQNPHVEADIVPALQARVAGLL